MSPNHGNYLNKCISKILKFHIIKLITYVNLPPGWAIPSQLRCLQPGRQPSKTLSKFGKTKTARTDAVCRSNSVLHRRQRKRLIYSRKNFARPRRVCLHFSLAVVFVYRGWWLFANKILKFRPFVNKCHPHTPLAVKDETRETWLTAYSLRSSLIPQPAVTKRITSPFEFRISTNQCITL